MDPVRIFCSACGQAVTPVWETNRRRVRIRRNPPVLPFLAGGAVVGAAIGFWFRPFVSPARKLSFEAVLTRGKSLRGIDSLLLPAAEASFDRMMLLAAIGVAIALLANLLLRRVR